MRSSAFLLNMNEVFEKFVWTAMREVLKVRLHDFPLNAQGRSLHLDVDHRLSIKPDLAWWKGSHCIFAGDIKYKDLDAEPARERDMSQLVAYMSSTNLKAGLLVYASKDAIHERYRLRHSDADVRVMGLGLDQEPDQVLRNIQDLANTASELADSGLMCLDAP